MDAPLIIEFTPEESERLRERARLHGYDDAADYVRAAINHSINETVDTNVDTFLRLCQDNE